MAALSLRTLDPIEVNAVCHLLTPLIAAIQQRSIQQTAGHSTAQR